MTSNKFVTGLNGNVISPNFIRRKISKNWQLYLFLLPAFIYFLVFHYIPIYGVQIAFKNYIASKGIWGSPWIGFDHFDRFFRSYYFWQLVGNTVLINLYQLVLFPVSIIVALSIHELKHAAFKRFVQLVTYTPHFISVVVISGMILSFLSPTTGIVNVFVRAFGGESIAFLTEPGWFKSVFVLSGEWQNLGWGAIIYLAALSGINPELHEAAQIDGATRVQRIFAINIPGIMPTIIILFILNLGSFMNVGFEKIYLLQNPLNMNASDVIQTHVYRNGLLQAQYSYTAAIGLFNNVINFSVLLLFNQLARRSGNSLW
ncbi:MULTISPECIES: sugar ABC transporter permease [unclassified Paenibacillus]|uniref:ABC transporter permease n=1 Tax=unclassified Paenibacillus TaxID=185978 RepID=UPI00096D6045|nr:ABC transporter permease subunit [Paenibacillus sp. FSL H7-0331]OMF04333.1 sugar ABC transporter permease [Paenibacillus sp. FSL H7-0331]